MEPTRFERGRKASNPVTLLDDTEIEALPPAPMHADDAVEPEVLDASAPRVTFSVGDVVDRRYRLLRLVRESDSTRTFVGHSLSTGAHVWIEHWMRHPERFHARARALALVRHRNVMRLLDARAEQRILVFELPVAVPLARLLRDEGPIELSRALRIAERVCWGAHALESAGMGRVEVRAGDILLTCDVEMGEEPMVIDRADASASSRAAREPQIGSADLGRLLMHLLTGRDPGRHVAGGAAAAELRSRGVSRRVALFVEGLMSHSEPTDRRSEAAALHQLRRACACLATRSWRRSALVAALIVAAAALSLMMGRGVARAIAPPVPQASAASPAGQP